MIEEEYIDLSEYLDRETLGHQIERLGFADKINAYAVAPDYLCDACMDTHHWRFSPVMTSCEGMYCEIAFDAWLETETTFTDEEVLELAEIYQ